MLQTAELKHLHSRKALLVSQSDANRRLLATEWQRLRAPENWVQEAGNLARRHPLWTAVLATAAGALTVQAVRKPGGFLGSLGRLGKAASLAFGVWKLISRSKPQP